MIAKYAGTCRGCRGKIEPGDEIAFDKETGTRHPKCQTSRKPQRDEQERLWQRLRRSFKPGTPARELEKICTR